MTEQMNNQEKLEEIYHMTKENNEVLRSMRRQQHIESAFRFFYWFVILIALGGAYYYIRPVVNIISSNKDKIKSTIKQFDDLRVHIPATNLFEQLLNNFKQSTSSETTTAQ